MNTQPIHVQPAAGRISEPFPAPPPVISRLFDDLALAINLTEQIARGGPGADSAREILATLGDPTTMPRPWDPARCPPSIRRELWRWYEDAVIWLNHGYGWSLTRTIPACWPEHPHLGHEIPVLITLRWQAAIAMTPAALEDWHRWSLPMFLTRLTEQIGTNGCPPGRHQHWPAEQRHQTHTHDPARTMRHRAYAADVAGGHERQV